MALRPLTIADDPSYPAKPVGLRGRIKRGAASFGISIALGLSCAGAPVETDPSAVRAARDDDKQAVSARRRNLEWCSVITLRTLGAPPPPQMLTCMTTGPDSLPVYDTPLSEYEGVPCANGPAGARLRIASPTRGRFNVNTNGFKLSIYAPDGTLVADLNDERRCADLDMEAGVWVVLATPTGRSHVDPDATFLFSFSDLAATPP
jgi:hypothetical protein